MRPTTEEQQRRRAKNRCRAKCPPQETPWTAASGLQCIRKGGHEGDHKVDFGWARLGWPRS